MTTNNTLLNAINAMLGNKEAARIQANDRLHNEAFLILRDGNSHFMRDTLDALSIAKGNAKVLHGFLAAFAGDISKKRSTSYKTLKKADVTETLEKTLNAFIEKGLRNLWTGYDSALQEKKDKAAATREANKAAKGTSATETASEETPAPATETKAAPTASIHTATLPKGWHVVADDNGIVSGFIIDGFRVSLASMADHAHAMQKALDIANAQTPAKAKKPAKAA